MKIYLSRERAIEIQTEQLKHWERVLKPEVYGELKAHCEAKNREATEGGRDDPDNGMYVFRGSDMDNFVANYRSRTERLKDAWNEVMTEIYDNNNLPKAVKMIERKMVEHIDDTSMLRMLLDTTQTVRDEELVKPVRKLLIDTIEARIGKIN